MRHDVRRREREGSSGGRDQIRQDLVNQMKEYGLYPGVTWSHRMLEGGIIRFACQKMCGKKRKEGQNWEQGDWVGIDHVYQARNEVLWTRRSHCRDGRQVQE